MCFPTHRGYINLGTLPSPEYYGYLHYDVESHEEHDDLPHVCIPAFAVKADWRPQFSGAINQAGALLDFWGLVGSTGSESHDRVSRILLRIAGEPQFRGTVSNRASRTGADCSERSDAYTVAIEIYEFEAKATAALGIDELPADMSSVYSQIRMLPRDEVPNAINGSFPSTYPSPVCTYTDPVALPGSETTDAVRCEYVAESASNPSSPDRVALLKYSGISDYVGGLLPAHWPPDGTGDSSDLGTRSGLWVLMLGSTILGWHNTSQFVPSVYRNPAPGIGDCASENIQEVGLIQGHRSRFETAAHRILERMPSDCRKPLVNSLGLPSSLVPPLDNEATLDESPFESAYRTYLRVADEATSEAAVMMIEAADAAHAVDRATDAYQLAVADAVEDAAAEVEQLCGETPAVGGTTVGAACQSELAPISESLLVAWVNRYMTFPSASRLSNTRQGLPATTSVSEIETAAYDCRVIAMTPMTYEWPGTPASEAFEDMRKRVLCSGFSTLWESIRPLQTMSMPTALNQGTLPDGGFGGEALALLGAIETQLDQLSYKFDLANSEVERIDSRFEILTGDILAAESQLQELGYDEAHIDDVMTRLLRAYSCTWGSIRCMSDYEITEIGLTGNIAHSILKGKAEAVHFGQFRVQISADIGLGLDSIRQSVWGLEDIAVRAENLVENRDRTIQVATAESVATDPWARRTVAAQHRRGQRAFYRARQLAFVARKAIEFKFVVALDELNESMLLGDVPAQWASDVFLDGYLLDAPVEQFMRPTADFVTHLQDFVNFYSASFPFQNGSRTVVLSLKDHIVGGEFLCCDVGVNCPGDPAPDPERRPCTTLSEGGVSIALEREYDHDGVRLQGAFSPHCAEPPVNGTCPVFYYLLRFWIALDDFGPYGKLGTMGLTAENFNYRIRNIAVNLIGANVRDCTRVSGDVMDCYASAYVPYDLVQTGAVALRDHNLRRRGYLLPAGGVLSGQALAAERFITSPIATADLELLSQYWAQEFAGRPLQGEFLFRLHNVEPFNFEELEDVQLVVQLDYWSPFRSVP